MRYTSLLLLLAAFLGCSGLQPMDPLDVPETAGEIDQPIRRLAFLGEAVLESGLEYEGTTVGGLSALTYDPQTDLYYALPDDPSLRHPTRLYGLEIDLSDGHLDTGDVTIASLLFLRDQDGSTFPTYAVDGEGLALTKSGSFFISSEGNVERGIQPFIREIAADGSPIRELTLPVRYRSSRQEKSGLRHNLAFEALTLTPEEGLLFAGTENALAQDGPEADLDDPSPSRILRFDMSTGKLAAEYLYWVEPVPEAPARPDGFKVNGLVELLALEGHQLLALERSFSAGVGNTARLYLVDLGQADDIHGVDLYGRTAEIQPVEKTLLLDLADLGIPLDNLEGLSHGPSLSDGRHTLLLISDNNFSPRQRTQVLAFAWSHHAVTLSQIQGAGHRSPHEGEWLFGVEGVVTAVDTSTTPTKVWLQDAVGDNSQSTSDGLCFETFASHDLVTGDKLLLSGRVIESSHRGSLSVTCLRGNVTRTLSRDNELPSSIPLDTALPTHFDDDKLAVFEPWNDAIDYYESLEGMRVQVPSPVVVGTSSRFGDFVVLPKGGTGLEPRTAAGGILLTAESGNPQRVQIDPRLLAVPEEAASSAFESLRVGAEFAGSMVGVLDYSFGAFEIVLTESPGHPTAPVSPADGTKMEGSETALTIATFNVENLDALDSPEKYLRVAMTIVEGLGAPDLLGLQEVQDESGTADDGAVSAAATLDRLVEEIVSLGGPRYEFHQIDPENNADGGQPGANIRVAYLVNPQRLNVPLRGTPGPHTPTSVEIREDGVYLSQNPGRVAPQDVAFAFNEALGYEASRKALALEIEFAGRQLFVINAHLSSKRGDDGLYGSVQPPRRVTEEQRLEQTRRIRSFVEEISVARPDAAIVVLGDLNEHEFRPPVRELAGGDLANLILQVPLSERYTYNYRGNSQVLDHILVSRSLAEEASPRIDIVHVNADAPASQRSSDHDPVVVRLDLSGL